MPGRLVDEVVAHRPEAARRLLRDDLQVRDARPAAGAPVDQRLGAVGESLAVQTQERLADRLRRDIVHRETEPLPIERGAHAALLAENRLARFVDELPHRLEVLLAAQAGARLALPARILSSTYWAAMEAWSRPGRKSAGRRCMRAWRTIRSSTVERCAWPRCSEPVTLGGGWMTTNDCLVQSAREPLPSGAKTSASSHCWYTAISTSPGWYALAQFARFRCSWCLRRVRHCLLHPSMKRPARPADERVVVPPAGSASSGGRSSRPPRRSSRRPGRALSTLYRAPPARLTSYVHVGPATGLSACSVLCEAAPISANRPATLLLSVDAVRRRS